MGRMQKIIDKAGFAGVTVGDVFKTKSACIKWAKGFCAEFRLDAKLWIPWFIRAHGFECPHLFDPHVDVCQICGISGLQLEMSKKK